MVSSYPLLLGAVTLTWRELVD